MADEEQQQVPQTQTPDSKPETEEDTRGHTTEPEDEPKPAATEEPKPEPPKEEPKTEEPSQTEEPKPEPPKREETPESVKTPREETKKEEVKKPEPPKTEPKRPETKKEERPFKPEPKREPARRFDGRGRTEETGDGAKKGVGVSKADSKSMQDRSDTSERRQRPKVEFFKEELKRLQENLKRESSKIVPPKRGEHKPFIFNTLEPYYNTHTTRYLIEMPGEAEALAAGFTFSSRSTAQGLIDPWIDLRMDQEILPQISSRPTTRSDLKSRGKAKAKKVNEPNRKEGSTRLPKFPVVAMETKDLVSKQLYYSDVPTLRKELKTKYSAQARSRQETDYKRTQQDFYRMDLDRLDQVPAGNRQHMTSTYMAYLNTPGSRRALNECVRNLQQGQAH